MIVEAGPPDERFFHILKKYSEGRISAANAAYEIQAEVICWAKMVGYGIPTPSEEQAEMEAAQLLRKRIAATRH
jgi:hypothetical protein